MMWTTLACLRVDQCRPAVDDDVLIPVRQRIFGKFARLENIRYDRPDYELKVGRTIHHDWISSHVLPDYSLLLGSYHDSLGGRKRGSSEKDASCNHASESHFCLLGLICKLTAGSRNGSPDVKCVKADDL